MRFLQWVRCGGSLQSQMSGGRGRGRQLHLEIRAPNISTRFQSSQNATRVASYNPFVSLYWFSTGKTVGGLSLSTDKAFISREEALRLYTHGSAWTSREQEKRGTLAVGKLADIVVLSSDYFTIPDEAIKNLESVLTILGGKPVYAAEDFVLLDPGVPPALPEWSPVRSYPGYWKADAASQFHAHAQGCGCARHSTKPVLKNPFNLPQWMVGPRGLLDGGCERFAF